MGLFYPESLGQGWNVSLTHIISSITFETLVSDLPGHRRRPRPGRGRPHKGPAALPSSNYPSFPPPSSETRSFFICQEAVCLQVELLCGLRLLPSFLSIGDIFTRIPEMTLQP